MRGVSLVIAVDGPAASGKGTIARALARHYGLPHLDTGLLYRAVGIELARGGGDPADPAAAERVARALRPTWLDAPDLRGEAASRLASVVSAHPGVRAALLAMQRAFAAQPGGAVLDGRDIGTVIVPDAPAKLFVTAPAEVRAERRWREGGGDYDAVLADIRARDTRDSGRAIAPLACADNADLLDTGGLTIDEAVRQAIALVETRLRRSSS
ncbi:MAG: d(CMP) kinase [Sphingomonadaceae bacterium]|nr:d(CMP) kinase [Sphingomonadaceae bacterium]